MYFSTKIDHPRIRHCNINRVKYSHKDLITNKKFSEINFTCDIMSGSAFCKTIIFTFPL